MLHVYADTKKMLVLCRRIICSHKTAALASHKIAVGPFQRSLYFRKKR